MISDIISKGEQTVLLTIINNSNQRRYLGVKLKIILPKKLILLAGPTASGKSKLALKLAKRIKGEIINADSMQVYKEISILTSRPSKKDIKQIKHHLYGFISGKKTLFSRPVAKTSKKRLKKYTLKKYQ